MSSCNIIVGNRLRERVLDLDSNNWTLQFDSFNFSESQFLQLMGGCKVQMRQQCQRTKHTFIHTCKKQFYCYYLFKKFWEGSAYFSK